MLISLFTIGRLVRLKSGGPIMTVMEVTPSGLLGCAWISNGELKGNAFSPFLLEFYPEGMIQ